MIPEGGYPFGAIPVIWIVGGVLIIVIGLAAIGMMAYILTRTDRADDAEAPDNSESLR